MGIPRMTSRCSTGLTARAHPIEEMLREKNIGYGWWARRKFFDRRG